jgi:hypothetical protein
MAADGALSFIGIQLIAQRDGLVVCLLRARTRPGQVARRRTRVSVMVRWLKCLHQRFAPRKRFCDFSNAPSPAKSSDYLLGPASSVQRRRSRYVNNRAENSHQPTRQRERAMKRFTSRHGQRFLSAVSGISAHFRPRRHLLSAIDWRTEMADRFAVWCQVAAPDAAA